MKYVALLRGINLGKRTVKMDKLRKMFEDMGFEQVRTLLASGNVVFAAAEKDAKALRERIEVRFALEFGFEANIILRSAAQIAALVRAAPFKRITAQPGMRFHVSFLGQPVKASKAVMEVKANREWVVAATKDHVAWVVDPAGRTVDYMDFLAQQFGDEITTRTWNTVEKIHVLLSE